MSLQKWCILRAWFVDCIFVLYPHMEEGVSKLSRASLIKALILFYSPGFKYHDAIT